MSVVKTIKVDPRVPGNRDEFPFRKQSSALQGQFHPSFQFKCPFCYFVIPIFCYVELWLNYTTKNVFFEEMSRKQEALLVGPIFSLLFSKGSLALFVLNSVPMILLFTPVDFKPNGKCIVCKGNDLFVGEELFQHMEQILVITQKYFFRLIKQHREGITEPIQFCTRVLIFEPSLDEDALPHRRCHRVLHTVCHLICDTIVISLCGLFLGAVYLFVFLVGIVLLYLGYSPFFTLCFALIRQVLHLLRTQTLQFLLQRRPDNYAVNHSFYVIAHFIMIIHSIFLIQNLTVACFAGALSCRFIVKMFGYIIIGLVLNAEIASPFATFVIAVSTNTYLCYYNLQKKYQEVKEMISQQWQKQKNDLLSTDDLSNSEEGTIPEDLFWYICSEKSKSKHIVLPIRPEIYRMLRNMVLILVFLVLALCSIIFLGNTYSISTVASTFAVFVTGVIPGLFFKGIIKGNKFSGPAKSDMTKKIEKAVEQYIKDRNKSGSPCQSTTKSDMMKKIEKVVEQYIEDRNETGSPSQSKGNKFSGPTKSDMMKKIERAVEQYIKVRDEPGSPSQSPEGSAISQ